MVKQVIVIRKDLNMRKGKIVAQASHASMKVWFDRMFQSNELITAYSINPESGLTPEMIEWEEGDYTKVVVFVNSEAELLQVFQNATYAELPCALITDLGKTEFHGEATETCLAIGPADSAVIDKITGHLKLL